MCLHCIFLFFIFSQWCTWHVCRVTHNTTWLLEHLRILLSTTSTPFLDHLLSNLLTKCTQLPGLFQLHPSFFSLLSFWNFSYLHGCGTLAPLANILFLLLLDSCLFSKTQRSSMALFFNLLACELLRSTNKLGSCFIYAEQLSRASALHVSYWWPQTQPTFNASWSTSAASFFAC